MTSLAYARVERIVRNPKIYYEHGFLMKNLITKEKIHLLPIPDDLRNYFVLQSIDDTTNVIIGDFTGSNRIITLITDLDNDETADKIIEYYVDSEKFKVPIQPSTSFYINLKNIKRQIIEGDIFKNNYSYKMNSLDRLKELIKNKENLIKLNDGYGIQIRDPEDNTRFKGEYFFGKKDGRYNLLFVTYSYELYGTQIAPAIFYSVYCKNSKDPLVAEIVESLLKLAR